MRFHLPGLPHTVTNKQFCHCAFTQKVYKLSDILTSLGHEVFHYGCEGSSPTCTENITVIEDEFRRRFYPHEWHDTHWDFNTSDDCHKTFYKNTISAIRERLQKQDILLCSWGWGHKPIADELGKSVLAVEPGIGYKDTFCDFRVFESYNWMSFIYGRGKFNPMTGKRTSEENGKYFDAVIPNYFDLDDFDYCPQDKEDYFLYLGRITKRKGLDIIFETIRYIGGHLKIAGQGKPSIPPQFGSEIISYVGFADIDKRRELLSKAKALIMPTIYLEPFGGVAVEAMLSGTPVICTDWGVFPETVLHGLTGYRCRTLDQFIWAAQNIGNISPKTCRQWAEHNFSLDRVGQMYQEYFEMIQSLWTPSGWYGTNPDRKQLDWLTKYYPKKQPDTKTKVKPIKINDDPTIYPAENEPDYALNLSWYKRIKEPGISFILRANNEENTIGMALESLKQLTIPYEVNVVLNSCTDDTETEVKHKMKSGQNINLFYYPFQLGKTGLENQCTPANSVHSTVWLLNWMLLKGKYEFTFRWDADFIMTSTLAKELEQIKNNIAVYNISAIFPNNGHKNTEPYLWSNYLYPRYARYSLWHMAYFQLPSPKVYNLQGTIIHDSPLTQIKDYWNKPPWWDSEDRPETEEMVKKSREKYLKLTSLVPECTTRGRASCPETEKLVAALYQQTGKIEIEEIVDLKDFILSLK